MKKNKLKKTKTKAAEPGTETGTETETGTGTETGPETGGSKKSGPLVLAGFALLAATIAVGWQALGLELTLAGTEDSPENDKCDRILRKVSCATH